MTLSEMVDFICGKVSQTETEDQAACRKFVQVRHDSAWADQLWKDSVYSYSQIVTPDNYAATATWLPTKQVLLCASEFEHILAVRTALRTLDIETPETFYRSNFDAFANTGDARQFLDLPRAVWEFDTAQTLYLQNDGQAVTTVIVDSVGADLISKVRTKQTIKPGRTDFSSIPVSRIDGFSKPAGDGPVSIGPLSAAPTTFTVSFTGLFSLGIAVNSVNPGDIVATLTQGQSAVINVQVGQTLYFFFDGAYLNSGFDSYAVTEMGTLTVTSLVDGGMTFSDGIVIIPVVTLAAADTNAPLRCRIQPVGTLPNPTTLRILGKARLGTFEEDNDECLIAGMDKVLLEFGVADMWERERQFGFAQQPFARGAALLDQLKKVQVCQQAYNKRLIPSGGYRDEYGLNSGTVFP
jgi:hypothetical protein